MEFTSNSPKIPTTAKPTKSGGSRNGIKVKVPMTLAAPALKDLSQLPNGIPTARVASELTTAIIAVVSSSSRLVVKDV